MDYQRKEQMIEVVREILNDGNEVTFETLTALVDRILAVKEGIKSSRLLTDDLTLALFDLLLTGEVEFEVKQHTNFETGVTTKHSLFSSTGKFS